MKNKQILIFGGTGAVGGALTSAALLEANQLLSGNAPVTIIGSGRSAKPHHSVGVLEIKHGEGSSAISYPVEYLKSDTDASTTSPIPPIRCVEQLHTHDNYDTIYVTVKSGAQDERLAQRIIEAAKPDADIVIVANGVIPPLYTQTASTKILEKQEAFYRHLNESGKNLHILQGIFVPGASNKEEPSENRRTVTISKPSPDKTFFILGSFNPDDKIRAEGIASSLDPRILKASVTEDIGKEIISKLIINRINLLCAVTGKDKKSVLDTEQGRALFTELAREELAVFAKLGFALEEPEKVVADILKSTHNAYTHNTSTLNDLLNGITQTERPALSGVIVELGNQSGVSVPVTTAIDHVLIAIEAVADKKIDSEQRLMKRVQAGFWENIIEKEMPVTAITDADIAAWRSQRQYDGVHTGAAARL